MCVFANYTKQSNCKVTCGGWLDVECGGGLMCNFRFKETQQAHNWMDGKVISSHNNTE